MSKLSIKSQLFGGAILSVIIIFAMAGVNLYASGQSAAALAEVYEHNVMPLGMLQTMDSHLREVRFRMAGVLLDQMPIQGSRNSLKETREKLPQIWLSFKAKAKDGQGKEHVAKIDKQMEPLLAFLDKLDKTYAAGDRNALGSLLADDWPTIHSGVLKPIAELIPLQEASVKNTYEGSIALGGKLVYVSLGAGVVSVIVLLLFALTLTGSINRNINVLKDALSNIAHGNLSVRATVSGGGELGSMADSLNMMVRQLQEIIGGVKSAADNLAGLSASMASAAGEVLERGDQGNAKIHEVSTAMEEMRASVAGISESADEAAGASGKTQSIANVGHEKITSNAEASRRMLTSVDESSAVIANLSESVTRISEVTKVIRDIADQTNLLALNAAIEAARAGEQGRGFAVVADEVRKLAERTGASTADITDMVGQITANTETAVKSMNEVKNEVRKSAQIAEATKDTLVEILAATKRVSDLANHIASATREQSAATENTASNMEAISEITTNNAGNVRSMANTAESVRDTASRLQNMVGQFKL